MSRRSGTIAALAAAGALALPAGGMAATDEIRAIDEFTYGGGTGTGGSSVFRLDTGEIPTLFNDDPDDQHNVVSNGRGPDGERLFENDLENPGDSAPVPGTQYLTAGDYPFFCIIHSGMTGTLQVVPDANGAVKRPKIDLAIKSAKLSPVRRTGKLKVAVKAINESDDVAIEAKFGRKLLAKKKNIDVSAGQNKRLTLKLTRAGKRALKNKDKATIKLSGAVPYGKPDKTSRTLR